MLLLCKKYPVQTLKNKKLKKIMYYVIKRCPEMRRRLEPVFFKPAINES